MRCFLFIPATEISKSEPLRPSTRERSRSYQWYKDSPLQTVFRSEDQTFGQPQTKVASAVGEGGEGTARQRRGLGGDLGPLSDDLAVWILKCQAVPPNSTWKVYYGVITDGWFRKTIAAFHMLEIFEIVWMVPHSEAPWVVRASGWQSGEPGLIPGCSSAKVVFRSLLVRWMPFHGVAFSKSLIL